MRTSVVEWGVLAFCVWQGWGVISAWRHSPYDRLGWLAFLVWLGPVLVGRAECGVQNAESGVQSGERGRGAAWRVWMSGLGLVCAVVGVIGDLNVLRHAGLALAIAGLAVTGWRWLGWLGLAVCWMPAVGWLGQGLAVSQVGALRVGAAGLALGLGIWARSRGRVGGEGRGTSLERGGSGA
jgi:hypothetical protein